MNKKVWIIIAIVIVLTGVLSLYSHEQKKTLEYCDNLDKVAVTVDGVNLTLRDLAFYIAYEETTVQGQAMIYSPDDPGTYWNLHIDGQFVKTAAKQSAMDMTIHDYIFYQLALEEGLELDEDEQSLLKDKQDDFWADLTEEQQKKLGVKEKVLNNTMYQLALAQKYQNLLVETDQESYEAYNMDGEAYEKMLAKHTYKVNDNVWDRISFGNIVITK